MGALTSKNKTKLQNKDKFKHLNRLAEDDEARSRKQEQV